MIPDLGPDTHIYLILGGLMIAALVARRVPAVRVLTTFAIWGAMLMLLFVVVRERGRFDPYLAQVGQMLNFGDQSVVGKELRIPMARDGHFWARVRIGGIERRMLIDSGATVTALSTDTAAAAGLEVRDALFPLVLRTANGNVAAQASTVDEMRLGNIVARDLPVVVSPAFGDTNVLGMNFLSRLKSWRVEGGVLIMVPHHPQDVA